MKNIKLFICLFIALLFSPAKMSAWDWSTSYVLLGTRYTSYYTNYYDYYYYITRYHHTPGGTYAASIAGGPAADVYPYGNMTDSDCGIAAFRNIERWLIGTTGAHNWTQTRDLFSPVEQIRVSDFGGGMVGVQANATAFFATVGKSNGGNGYTANHMNSGVNAQNETNVLDDEAEWIARISDGHPMLMATMRNGIGHLVAVIQDDATAHTVKILNLGGNTGGNPNVAEERTGVTPKDAAALIFNLNPPNKYPYGDFYQIKPIP